MGISDFFDIEDDGFNYEKERQSFIDNLNMLKAMTVEEQTLYKKWDECQSLKNRYESSLITKGKIWKPADVFNKEQTLQELVNLKPALRLAENGSDAEDWVNLRTYAHTMAYDMTPGRMLKILVFDEVTERYLGAISLSSDVTDISVRDAYIGWKDEHKYEQRKLRCTSIASCIMATQPLGYNFLGGKLVAALLSIKYIRDLWYETYGDVLAGITTTSLYGVNSMYNGIPYWKTLGESAGKVYIKPDDTHYYTWHHWLQEHKSVDYIEATSQKEGVSGPVTGVKQKIISMIFRQLDIKSSYYMHGFQRGVFFMPFYENTNDFLTGKIDATQLKIRERIAKDRDGVLEWWKIKAERRYVKLIEEGHVKPDTLYYNKMSFMTWEEAKQQYLNDVGR
jgi:hypothetical protein